MLGYDNEGPLTAHWLISKCFPNLSAKSPIFFRSIFLALFFFVLVLFLLLARVEEEVRRASVPPTGAAMKETGAITEPSPFRTLR